MKIAIDSYCYHRYFGEVYPGLQQPPGRTMTVWDFLKRAKQLGVAGVSGEAAVARRFRLESDVKSSSNLAVPTGSGACCKAISWPISPARACYVIPMPLTAA